MRTFRRKPIMPILFFLCGLLILLAAAMQFLVRSNGYALFLGIIAVIFIGDALTYLKPYLGLDEKKLFVSVGMGKQEILLADITAIDVKNKKLFVTFRQGSQKQRMTILLSHLKKREQGELVSSLKAKLGDEPSPED